MVGLPDVFGMVRGLCRVHLHAADRVKGQSRTAPHGVGMFVCVGRHGEAPIVLQRLAMRHAFNQHGKGCQPAITAAFQPSAIRAATSGAASGAAKETTRR